MRLEMSSANFNGVVDAANKLFEHILRVEFETRFPRQHIEKLDDLMKSGVINIPYERVSLGQLAAGRKVGCRRFQEVSDRSKWSCTRNSD